MKKLKKLKLIVTIVLLSSSINSLSNNHISFTGELDSVLISYDDLRIANSKLVDLVYTKEINTKLKEIISNDSIIIKDYEITNANLHKATKRYKRQRNITFVSCLVVLAGFVTALIK